MDDYREFEISFVFIDIEMIKMSLGTSIFENTFVKTQEWLLEIMHELGLSSERKAYLVLRNTLHALRDMLTVNEAVELGSQFPVLMKGFYYDGWTPGRNPQKMTKEEFLDRISRDNRGDVELGTIHPEDIVRAVFRVVLRKTSEGEMVDIRSIFPQDMKELIE